MPSFILKVLNSSEWLPFGSPPIIFPLAKLLWSKWCMLYNAYYIKANVHNIWIKLLKKNTLYYKWIHFNFKLTDLNLLKRFKIAWLHYLFEFLSFNIKCVQRIFILRYSVIYFHTDCVVNLKKSKNVFFAKRKYIIKYLDLVS